MKPKNRREEVETIQFRPGPALGRMVSGFAETWQVNRHHVGKRLIALAVYGLDVSNYESVAQLAQAMGGLHDFVRAAEHIRVAIDSANRARRLLKSPELSEQEKQSFVQQTAREFKGAHSDPTGRKDKAMKRHVGRPRRHIVTDPAKEPTIDLH